MHDAYVFISIASSLVLLILIFTVLKRDVHSRSNQLAALLFFMFFLWSILDAIQRATQSEHIAFMAMSAIIGIAIFSPPLFFHLSYVFPWKKRSVNLPILLIYGISFLLAAIHANSDYFISGMKMYDYGYDLVPGDYAFYLFVYISFMMLASLFFLLFRYSGLEGERVLSSTRYLIAGIATIIIPTIFTVTVPASYGDYSQYPLTTVSFGIGGLIMIYGFSVSFPGVKASKASSKVRNLPNGIKTMPKEKAYPEFHRMLEAGMGGLCITGRNPEEVKEEASLKDVPVIHAREVMGNSRGKEAIESLYFAISDAVMDRGTVVLLDSVSSLIGGRSGERALLDEMKRLYLKGLLIYVKD